MYKKIIEILQKFVTIKLTSLNSFWRLFIDKGERAQKSANASSKRQAVREIKKKGLIRFTENYEKLEKNKVKLCS
jgi:hypothetical protein